jgi:dTDP-glucose 4,6-dehydratase
MNFLVTGGAGFIGSHFVAKLLSLKETSRVTALDNLTYAGRRENLVESLSDNRFTLKEGDIRDIELVQNLVKDVDYVVNFAAESHVDRSIISSSEFVSTNIQGTQVLLEASLKHKVGRFLQVSTDEVYGSISKGHWTEDSPLLPNSPYSASKASADLLVRAFNITYSFNTVITRCSNNFGPRQYPEKLIPLSIINLIEGKNICLYGNGLNIRDWLHVKDHCEGIYNALIRGESGSIYNLGAGAEKTNLEIASIILDQLGLDRSRLEFVGDRLGHDFRYSVSFEKAQLELGFYPKISFEEGMKETVNWYRDNEMWWRSLERP